MISLSERLGLNRSDYPFPVKEAVRNVVAVEDPVHDDFVFTDAAIHFFTHIQTGNKAPSFRYDGLKYKPETHIPAKLHNRLYKGGLKTLLGELQPWSEEYKSMLYLLQRLLATFEAPGFEDAKVTEKKVDNSNTALLNRLYQLGITDTLDYSVEQSLLVKKVREGQRRFDVLADGILRATTLQAFNTPVSRRIRELKEAINTLRWLEQLKRNGPVAVINLPSAYLLVYDRGTLIMDSKIIVGKRSTPTPVLTSTIKEVILYPYWNVPYSIATRELLPSIKHNIGYLDAHNYQVLNKEGKVLNPHTINWSSLHSGNFPYVIRQSTGCDNALGIVKFNFYNPFTVYLHDTPSKGLFSLNKRYFSHGCMRIENYLDFAHYLLGPNSIAIDTLTAKGCLRQQAPRVIHPTEEVPIVVLYSTVWYNKEGLIRFYEDVYSRVH